MRLNQICHFIKSCSKRQSCEATPKTLEDLETFALEEFYAIPDKYAQKLIKSIKNRMILTKINRGGFARYLNASKFYLV